MAIYDLGTASLAANGEVTGVGTTWKAPLTLIRVGATIVFKTEPVQIYTISEIISDTQVNVYNPNSETVPAGTGYAILAHDGITVQGLAQDVAETLRYYQSRETEIADAVDAFNNFDSADFESKVVQVNTQHGDVVTIGTQVANDAAQVTTDKNSAAASASSALSAKDAAAISAQEAADYAASLDTSNLLRRDLNFSDVEDKDISLSNLGLNSEFGFAKVGFSTYSDIRAYAGVEKVSYCLGRNSPGDGCDGVFVLDESDSTSQDNDGTVLVSSNGGRWKRLFDGVAQQRWFGDEESSLGWDNVQSSAESNLKSSTHDIGVTKEDVTVQEKTLKAYRRPEGIKDSACAGAFILGDFIKENEPSASITGFDDYSKIGIYPGRDSVALFAQNEGTMPYYFGDGVFYSDTLVSNELMPVINELKPGMIIDVNFGQQPNWVGTVITDVNTQTGVITTSGWVKIDGTSAPASIPPQNSAAYINRHNNLWAANFNTVIRQNDGATQAIGIETGLSLLKTGSGVNSKVYYAANLVSGVGEDPEYAFVNAGRFKKGFTADSIVETSFLSKNLAQGSSYHCKFLNSSGTPVFAVGPSGVEYNSQTYQVISSSLSLAENVIIGIVTAPDVNVSLGSASATPLSVKKIRNATAGSISVNGSVILGPDMYGEFFSDGSTWITLFRATA